MKAVDKKMSLTPLKFCKEFQNVATHKRKKEIHFGLYIRTRLEKKIPLFIPAWFYLKIYFLWSRKKKEFCVNCTGVSEN